MKWISVEDRLPDKDGSYIVCTEKSDRAFTAHFYSKDGVWTGRNLNKLITHWMELPKKPTDFFACKGGEDI